MNKATKEPICSECNLNFKTIFSGLPKNELDIITKEKTCGYYKKSSIIYQENSRIKGFYCVNSGILKVYKTGIEGKEQIIRFAKKGDVIGYRSVLSGELACTSAKVIEDATLCYITSETLNYLLKNNSTFSIDLLQLVCAELREANSFITDIAQKSVRERLAEVLLILKETFEVDNNKTLQISLTREELANIVGTATESVIRLLSEFKNEKLISFEGKRIKLIDIERLTKLANVFD
ncbi:MAG TPA: Crp/Fnr family transcriptional regulator [Bacteroidales bacterium]|nr:MAG: Crp/Fnr family transcriptional regulator [Bacteroidetes bacterium GWF2_33_38]OFY71614.1 MAG: Crp/Fnr family transcriptional regulator [Bacteroidetes bacterium RIFOXYA12_FULL_33_9]OFY91214.1 MAG: Crp/Fnr family transcriptional regulator [Bacteroidetes bacterium RIFOXYA2_FULL_33_7]HBF87109.1 Crp/Fnr family transcriptional regulator [Bacteroidales bacterium]